MTPRRPLRARTTLRARETAVLTCTAALALLASSTSSGALAPPATPPESSHPGPRRPDAVPTGRPGASDGTLDAVSPAVSTQVYSDGTRAPGAVAARPAAGRKVRLTKRRKTRTRGALRLRVTAPRTVRTGERIVLRGRAEGAAGRTPVQLSLRNGSDWAPLDVARTQGSGAFTLTTPAGEVATTHHYRLQVAASRKVRGATLRITVRVDGSDTQAPAQPTEPASPPPNDPKAPAEPATPPLGAPTDWTWLFGDVGARWDPCTPIGWGYEPSGGYEGALTDLQTALDSIALRTGLTFAYRGAKGEDLNITWSDESAQPRLAGAVVGFAGATGYPLPPGTANVGYRLHDGVMVLDRQATLRSGFAVNGRATWGQVMTHELLHALGLGHAAGSNQLMFGAATSSNHRFGAGDLSGMTAIGAGGGCLTTGRLYRLGAGEPRVRWAPTTE